MGQSSSSERRRRSNSYPQPQPYTYPAPAPPTPPPAATSYTYSPNPPNYHPNPNPNPNPNPYPLPPPPHNNNNNNNNNTNTDSSYSYQLASGYNSLVRFVESLMGGGRSTAHYPPPPPPYYYGPNQGNGGWVPSPSSSSSMMPPQYVAHERAKTVKNDVNVHKDTIRLQLDDQHPDQYLVSFVFDAMVDGSVTIYYFAQEGTNGDFSPVYADMYTPKRFPFQKGLGQKFCQPSGSGIDLDFFELDDLSKPLNGDVFPLVIYAKACTQPPPMDAKVDQHTAATCAQITQAVIQKTNDEYFQVKVMKQILWANGKRYELQEIFGLVNAAESETEAKGDDADDMGKDCVICLSEPRNTAVLPCRHMCMCSECAKALRLQSNKCPICRQPVEKLMEINVKRSDH